MQRNIAVVGSGVAGLTAAYVASRTGRVTLYEADERLGGHADTHQVTETSGPTQGQTLGIDTGFIVHNPRTYPVLLRMFAELGVATQPSEMSMSIRDDGTGLEWAGALGREGVLPTVGHLRNPRYLRMLGEIPWFHRRAKALLDQEHDERTLREFLDDGRFSDYFTRHFMEPMVAAVWSCDPGVALEYPARYLFTFLEHHGMLGIFGSPQWRTVTGGSHSYVAKVAAAVTETGSHGQIRTGTKVTSIVETASGVHITDGSGSVESYDAVVIATHPSHALSMLAEPTDLHRDLLGAMPYSANTAILHTDTSLMPELTQTWASWNFRRPDDSASAPGQVMVTYDLTRLQRLPTETHYLVTLGGEHLIDPATIIDRMEYEHPLYNPTSVAAQKRLPELNTDRVAFAGAYHGWGFHEDGARSGLAAAERIGLTWPGLDTPRSSLAGHSTTEGTHLGGRVASASDSGGRVASASERIETPAIYETTISHTRRQPFTRSFRLRSHTWLVDVDDLPDHGVLGRFEARDHLGEPDRSIRANVEAFLAEHDLTVGAGKILMAANARALGYCFNPITVFWCWNDAGEQVATVVEVHNTYGDRHAYLVHPDASGWAITPKAMYVSPFHGTDGTYELSVPVPDERLTIVVALHTDDGAKFTAALAGTRSSRSPLRAAPAALRGALLIRAHGIWLWLRRLPIRPRPQHHQEGVS